MSSLCDRSASELSEELRDDEPKPSLSREEALAGAPEVEADRFKVPRIVEME